MRRLALYLAVIAAILINGSCEITGPFWGGLAFLGVDDQHKRETDRDKWQEPALVLDALGVKAGSRVADVGAGDGYFTAKLSERVGSSGEVFAVDVDSDAVRKLKRRFGHSSTNVQIIKGADDDPKLPAALSAILVVDAYHEMADHAVMVEKMLASLAPGGLLGVIDRTPGSEKASRAEYTASHVIPEEMVKSEITVGGFEFVRRENFIKASPRGFHQFFLIFRKRP